MKAGNEDASIGLAKEIFLAMDSMLENTKTELLQELNLEPTSEDGKKIIAAIDDAKPKTKKMSYCIATGIVNYLTNNLPKETDCTETHSSIIEDPEFWSWLKGFTNAFKNWDETTGVQGLKQAISFYTDNVPQSLKGVLR